MKLLKYLQGKHFVLRITLSCFELSFGVVGDAGGISLHAILQVTFNFLPVYQGTIFTSDDYYHTCISLNEARFQY